MVPKVPEFDGGRWLSLITLCLRASWPLIISLEFDFGHFLIDIYDV